MKPTEEILLSFSTNVLKLTYGNVQVEKYVWGLYIPRTPAYGQEKRKGTEDLIRHWIYADSELGRAGPSCRYRIAVNIILYD